MKQAAKDTTIFCFLAGREGGLHSQLLVTSHLIVSRIVGFPGWNIYYIGLCSWNTISEQTRETRRYKLWQSGGTESASDRQNDVSFGPSVPEGVEWHLYPACGGALLGPRTYRITR
jgi:hypothetical protein